MQRWIRVLAFIAAGLASASTRAENPAIQRSIVLQALDAITLQGRPATIELARGADGLVRDVTLALQLQDQPAQVQVPDDGRPVRVTRRLEGDLKVQATVFLGVSVTSPPPAVREQMRLQKGTGLVVEQVEAGSPADAAGIKQNDILEKLDTQLLINIEQLNALVRSHQAGDEIKLTVLHQGESTTVPVKLAEKQIPVFENTKRAARAAPYATAKPAFDVAAAEVAAPPRNAFNKTATANRASAAMAAAAKRNPRLPPGRLEAITWADDEHTFALSSKKNGEQREIFLVARTPDGTVVFDGPINTEDERKALPKDIAEKLESPFVAPIIDSLRGNAVQPVGAGIKGPRAAANQ